MDSDVKSFASVTLPTLQEHLKSAQELQAAREAAVRIRSSSPRRAQARHRTGESSAVRSRPVQSNRDCRTK